MNAIQALCALLPPGMTQGEQAGVLGVHQTRLSRWLGGKESPQLRMVEQARERVAFRLGRRVELRLDASGWTAAACEDADQDSVA